MKAKDLVLRCYLERENDGSWFAICLDLNLYCRADSSQEARNKLHSIIRDYIVEAVSEDSEYFSDLIPRRAPAYFWLRYYMIALVHRCRNAANGFRFFEHLPLRPA